MTNEDRILALLENIQADVSGIKTEMADMKAEMADMKADINDLKSEMAVVKADIKRLDAKINALSEAEEITRDGVNTLIEWAEDVGNAIRFPLPRIGTPRSV